LNSSQGGTWSGGFSFMCCLSESCCDGKMWCTAAVNSNGEHQYRPASSHVQASVILQTRSADIRLQKTGAFATAASSCNLFPISGITNTVPALPQCGRLLLKVRSARRFQTCISGKRDMFVKGKGSMPAAGNVTLDEKEKSRHQHDADLIRQILDGDKRLFHELVRPYERSVYLSAYAVLKNHADAEEAAQETMIKAFTRLRQLSEPGKFKAWLSQIAINEARLKRRNEHGHLFEPMEQEAAEETDPRPRDFADWRENPEETLDRVEVRTAVARALSGLPGKYRDVFVLRDVELMNINECATSLGLSEEAVKVRLHRARLMMRERLAPVFKKRWLDRVFPGKGRKPW
jgi:RNA polymerase sigma-70 factor, ECF subfamily